MKIRVKDFNALARVINEEYQIHGSNGWGDQSVIVKQSEENVQDGVLVSTLEITVQYSIKRKNYNGKEFTRQYSTTVELCDTNEKQPVKITRVISKDPDDDAPN